MKRDFIIKLNEIGFWRGKKCILSGINCQINHRKHLAIIGPNGSGKTSLIKLIAGLEYPSAGTIEFYGQPRGNFDFRILRKKISTVSQSGKRLVNGWQKCINIVTAGFDSSYSQYREFTANEYNTARTMMKQTNCLDCAEKPFDILSEGQQQRIMIARALINNPDILILDEPCNGLDPAGRRQLAADIENLANTPEGPTILYVTHYIEEIYPYIDKVLALKNGKRFSYSTPDEALTKHNLSKLFDYPL